MLQAKDLDPFEEASASEDEFPDDFNGFHSDGSRVWRGDDHEGKPGEEGPAFVLRQKHVETPWRPSGPDVKVPLPLGSVVRVYVHNPRRKCTAGC